MLLLLLLLLILNLLIFLRWSFNQLRWLLSFRSRVLEIIETLLLLLLVILVFKGIIISSKRLKVMLTLRPFFLFRLLNYSLPFLWRFHWSFCYFFRLLKSCTCPCIIFFLLFILLYFLLCLWPSPGIIHLLLLTINFLIVLTFIFSSRAPRVLGPFDSLKIIKTFFLFLLTMMRLLFIILLSKSCSPHFWFFNYLIKL